jgi:hypothetical protein
MNLRQTHTFAELELSAAAYDEIAAKLREAGYDHAFELGPSGVPYAGGPIDMHGIGVTRGPGLIARPRAEWSEEDHDVLWWHFPIEEPPHFGSPLDDDWPESDDGGVYAGYYTHWTPIVVPAESL